MKLSQHKISFLHDSILIVVLFLPCGVFSRYFSYQDLDLETSAAEPRPAFIDKPDTGQPEVAYALPLTHSLDDEDSHISDASEKVEKTVAPTKRFSYSRHPEDLINERRPDNEEDKRFENDEDGDEELFESDHVKGEASNPDQEINNSEKVEQKHADAKAESSGHGKADHGGHHGEFEKGGGKEFHSDHKGEHGEKGEKKYDGHHHHEKQEKGHHTKDHHHKDFAEKGGDKKKYHHKDGYHGEHHKEEKGEKGSKYEEHGDHNKGHSTKGSHYIHKKDEFDKKTEFFDEDEDSAEFEKHGGFSHKDGYKKGGHQKGGYDKGGTHKDHYGKEEKSEKGGHYKEDKGHKHKGGHENHHSHHDKHGQKESHGGGKKWSHSKGHDSGGGGGGGHKGSHSHVSVAVQKPPNNEKVVDANSEDSELKESKQVAEHLPIVIENVKTLQDAEGLKDKDVSKKKNFKKARHDHEKKQIKKNKLTNKEDKKLEEIIEDSTFELEPNNEELEREDDIPNSSLKSVFSTQEDLLDTIPTVKKQMVLPAPFSLPNVNSTNLEFRKLLEATDSPKPKKKKKIRKKKKVTSETAKKHDCKKDKEPLISEESRHFIIVAADENT